MSDIVIFAIDPGTIDTGIAFARNGELIETDTLHVPKSHASLERTLEMMNKIAAYVTEKHDVMHGSFPEIHIAYENATTFHGQDGAGRPITSLLNLAVLIEYWARKREYKTFPYKVTDIKEGIAGSPGASKQEVEAIMRHEHNLHEMKVSNHEWDAVSVWTYHMRQLAIQAAII